MYMLCCNVSCAQAAADEITIITESDRIKIIIANVGDLMEVQRTTKELLIVVNRVD